MDIKPPSRGHGGYAFPTLDRLNHKGATLREVYAGQALQGLLANPQWVEESNEHLAERAQALAQTLIDAAP